MNNNINELQQRIDKAISYIKCGIKGDINDDRAYIDEKALLEILQNGTKAKEETNLYNAIIDEINIILECYDDYKNVELSNDIKSEIAWDIINYEENLWEKVNNTICDYIRKELVKNYMNKESD